MPLTIPNTADAGFGPQAEPDSRDFDAIVNALGGSYVLSGCLVTWSSAMIVSVAAGNVLSNSTGPLAISTGTKTLTADATNPRFYLIVIDSAGLIQARAGTAAAAPVFPALTAGDVTLAAVYVPANASTLAANTIVDKRVVAPPTSIVKMSAGQSVDAQQWQDSSGTILVKVTSAGKIGFSTGGSIDPSATIGSAQNDLRITATDYLHLSGGFTTLIGPMIGADSQGAAAVGVPFHTGAPTIYVRAQSSGTDDIEQWQANNGSVLGKIDHSGNLIVPTIGVNSTAVATDRIIAMSGLHPGTATTLYGMVLNPSTPATTTAAFYGIYLSRTTAASAFTLATQASIYIDATSIGSGSVVTNNYGMLVQNQGVAGVTNAYGLSIAAQSGAATLNVAASLGGGTQANLWLNSNTASQAGGIAFGTARDVNLYRYDATTLQTDSIFAAGAGLQVLAGPFQVDSAGKTAINTTTLSTQLLQVGGAFTAIGQVNLYGIAAYVTFGTSATTAGYQFYAQSRTAASAFTQVSAYGYYADAPVVGAGSAITNDYGLYVANQGASGVTNAYGIVVAAQSSASSVSVAARLDGGSQANLWLNSDTASVAGGISLGTARDTSIYRLAAQVVGIGNFLSLGSNAAGSNPSVGTGAGIRLPNNSSIAARNQANSADLNIVFLDVNNWINLGYPSTNVTMPNLVGIGAYNPTSGQQLSVQSAATTTVGLTVKSIALQTASIAQFQDSQGVVLDSLSPIGLRAHQAVAISQAQSASLLYVVQAQFDGATQGWVAVTNCSIAASNAQFFEGTGSMSMTSTASGTMTARTTITGQTVGVVPSQGIPVTPGFVYTASAYLRAAATPQSVHVDIVWYTAGGATISTSTGGNVTDSTSVWTRNSNTATAPANAAWAAEAVTYVTTSGANEVHYVDAVMFNQGDLKTYALPGSLATFTVKSAPMQSYAGAADILQINAFSGASLAKVDYQGQATFYSPVLIQGSTRPGAPTVTPQGTAGTTTYNYQVTAVFANAGETLVGTTGSTTTGNASLSTTNYNLVTWSAVPGAIYYKVYGRTTFGLLATVYGTSYADNGQTSPGVAAPPSVGNSPQLVLQTNQDAPAGLDSLVVRNQAGTTLFSVDTSGNPLLSGTTGFVSQASVIGNGTTSGGTVAQAVNKRLGITGGSGTTGSVIAGQQTITMGAPTTMTNWTRDWGGFWPATSWSGVSVASGWFNSSTTASIVSLQNGTAQTFVFVVARIGGY